ncbi:MAG: hypothetical protein H6677_10335 [Candidatus Obscuribacterales bacterium]|nr:hypothetical protein [Candidatus Obscuribacterales bacterium]
MWLSRKVDSQVQIQVQIRNNSGRTLFKSLFLFVVVAAALLLLGVSFLRRGGKGTVEATNHSPVESAALAAVEGLGRIVINTEEFGYIALASQPANGTMAAAGDGYSLPIRGINEIAATIRLDMIIADKLGEPLIKEFAAQDYKAFLRVKSKLVEELSKSLEEKSECRDRNNEVVKPHAIATSVYQKLEFAGVKEDKIKIPVLKLSLGCLKEPGLTDTPLPSTEKGFYKSYKDEVYDGNSFVLAGLGEKPIVIEKNNWVEKPEKLAYFIPSIIKVEVLEPGSKKVAETACAQPAGGSKFRAVPGALTISFPDGQPPEIKRPHDIYLNKQLNNPELEPMKLVTARGGDFPTDPGSFLDSYKWPLNNVGDWEPTANVWRLALYDWIRRAGAIANVESVVNMQEVTLDRARPENILWKAPLIHNGPYVTLQPISSGIVHIFEFGKDGIVDYRSKIIMPYPIYPASESQLTGRGIAALTFSEVGEKTIHLPTTPKPKKVVLKAAYDIYIRDNVRNLGSLSGGKHGGEPLAMPVLSALYKSPLRPQGAELPFFVVETVALEEEEGGTARIYNKGKQIGYQPTIAPQSDFGESTNPKPPYVKAVPFGRGPRPFYKVSGSAVDIRFRRQLDVSELNDELSTGYFGITQEDK